MGTFYSVRSAFCQFLGLLIGVLWFVIMDNITEAEAELYDRQIRLWGLDAQRRLRAASVLLIGLKGLGAEVAKNIILSGVKAITLMDHQEIEEEDKMSQFFVSNTPLGQNRAEASCSSAQLLNPMVAVSTETDNPANKADEFFTQFVVMCLASMDIPLLILGHMSICMSKRRKRK